MGRFSKLERETQDALAIPKPSTGTEKSAPAALDEDYDASYYTRKADDAFFTGDFRQGLQLYSRAIQIDNTRHDAWLGQIYCLVELAQGKDADLWTGRALELFPEDPALLSLRAMMYANRGMVKRALNTSDYAISRKGADAHSYVARGYILLQADNRNSGFCFTKAIELAGENDWQIPARIGFIYFKRRNYSRAMDFFQKACSLNLRNFWLWHHLGLCYRKLGFMEKARECFQNALDANPDFEESRNLLTRVAGSSIIERVFRFILRR